MNSTTAIILSSHSKPQHKAEMIWNQIQCTAFNGQICTIPLSPSCTTASSSWLQIIRPPPTQTSNNRSIQPRLATCTTITRCGHLRTTIQHRRQSCNNLKFTLCTRNSTCTSCNTLPSASYTTSKLSKTTNSMRCSPTNSSNTTLPRSKISTIITPPLRKDNDQLTICAGRPQSCACRLRRRHRWPLPSNSRSTNVTNHTLNSQLQPKMSSQSSTSIKPFQSKKTQRKIVK